MSLVNEVESPAKVTEEIDEDVLDKNTNDKSIIVTGHIDVPPDSKSSVSPFFDGYVKQINIIVGQSVQKGETLFILQNPEYLDFQQSFLEAKERLAFLELDYNRQKSLAEEQISSEKKFKQAEADYKSMLARYSAMHEKIKLMGLDPDLLEATKLSSEISIRAPISGSITAVNISRNAYVDAKVIALEIVNLSHKHLELEVFEKDILNVTKGQEIVFTVPETGSTQFKGEVYMVGKSVDNKRRSVLVHGHIDEAHEGLNIFPGMFVEAKILFE